MRVNSLRIENHSRKGITVAVVTIILLLISITLRIYNLDLPLSADIHSFRQTQTAITVQEWLFSGYSALRYQTPVLGPPWTAMMEFPVYQTTVYVFVRLFSFTNLDLACRIVSVFYFYISVIALNSFCKLFFDNIQRASILIPSLSRTRTGIRQYCIVPKGKDLWLEATQGTFLIPRTSAC